MIDDNTPLSEAELLEEFLLFMVDHPEQLRVREEVRDNRLILTVNAAPEDLGRVIGKNGENIQKLRAAMDVIGWTRKRRIRIFLNDPNRRRVAA